MVVKEFELLWREVFKLPVIISNLMVVRQVFGCNYIVDEAHPAIICKENL